MCLAIPGKIIKIEGENATIDYEVEQRTASTQLMPEIKIGDYVICQAGFIMKKIDETTALESINTAKQM
ncbi:HypC/HybG/HupF family hydrogenase formation chaperone [Candidatus Woesearchaeota archaeon]|nr:HypC/HybG/HupF family hydrogenase formation chaperone [Candidatus Woesearchaeota archaeon]